MTARDAGRPQGRPASSLVAAALAALALTWAGEARSHSPFTAIGRAVEAFGGVTVSYEPGAAVSDVEAGNFTTVVGSNPKVAFMPAEAATEVAGGPDGVAAEIAREAELDGTLVVLVGTKLGAWSNEIGDERLAELVRNAQTAGAGSPAATTEALVRSVQAEPTSSTPWALIGAVLLVLASGAFVAYHWLTRRGQPAS